MTYTLEGTSHTDTFYISQTGSSGYAYTDEFYTPFVNNFTMTFHSSFNPSTGTLTQTTTEFDPTVYTAPHYTSVADY
ncbi:MAG: hypothetical protein J6S85_03420 [Methanobrevibacter sp.]|nr:hypothetical protein [Methanobrevibacter sp.]